MSKFLIQAIVVLALVGPGGQFVRADEGSSKSHHQHLQVVVS